MQMSEESKLEQQAPEDGGTASGSGAMTAAPDQASKKKASKKKASKKKASKKKASKKKASKKKASKKKASKKKASKKKKASYRDDSFARIVAAVEELRDAVNDLAGSELRHRREAVEDLRAAARAKISDLETAAQRSLARLTGKG